MAIFLINLPGCMMAKFILTIQIVQEKNNINFIYQQVKL